MNDRTSGGGIQTSFQTKGAGARVAPRTQQTRGKAAAVAVRAPRSPSVVGQHREMARRCTVTVARWSRSWHGAYDGGTQAASQQRLPGQSGYRSYRRCRHSGGILPHHAAVAQYRSATYADSGEEMTAYAQKAAMWPLFQRSSGQHTANVHRCIALLMPCEGTPG